MDLSLSDIMDLTTNQRRDAERSLALAERHLAAQQQKIERLADLLERLPEFVADQPGDDASQPTRHRRAARKEYDRALVTLQKLQALREKLQKRVQTGLEVEEKMQLVTATAAGSPRA